MKIGASIGRFEERFRLRVHEGNVMALAAMKLYMTGFVVDVGSNIAE